jgi:TorA maturation chaperone TorD
VEGACRYLNLQKNFLKNHLLKWVPDLCKSLKETADSKLYKSLAYLTNGLVSMEAEVVEEFTKTLEPLTIKKSKPGALKRDLLS